MQSRCRFLSESHLSLTGSTLPARPAFIKVFLTFWILFSTERPAIRPGRPAPGQRRATKPSIHSSPFLGLENPLRLGHNDGEAFCPIDAAR